MFSKILTGAAVAALASASAFADCGSGSGPITPEGLLAGLEECGAPAAGDFVNPAGSGNFLQVQQLGAGAIAIVDQNGSGNFIDLTQRDNSDARIRQFGNNNAAIVNQPSDAILFLEQRNGDNYFEVDQAVDGFQDIEVRQDGGAAIIIREG